MVTRIDRLARSIGDLQDIVRTVKARGASLKATEQPIDTSTAAGNGTADIPFRISRATPGYTVEVEVNVDAHGASRSCTTSFTPQ